MQAQELVLDSESTMADFGVCLGRALKAGMHVYLQGDLGAGKTTLCRGILHARGHQGAVKSPTYTLVEPYALPGGTVYHFDLYRLQDTEELEYIGIRDYFDAQSICLVEWPEKGGDMLPVPDIILTIRMLPQGRRLAIMPKTPRGQVVADQLVA